MALLLRWLLPDDQNNGIGWRCLVYSTFQFDTYRAKRSLNEDSQRTLDILHNHYNSWFDRHSSDHVVEHRVCLPTSGKKNFTQALGKGRGFWRAVASSDIYDCPLCLCQDRYKPFLLLCADSARRLALFEICKLFASFGKLLACFSASVRCFTKFRAELYKLAFVLFLYLFNFVPVLLGSGFLPVGFLNRQSRVERLKGG